MKVWLFLSLFLCIGLVSATNPYTNCEVYGTCNSVSGTTIKSGANYTINVTNADNWAGHPFSYLADVFVPYLQGLFYSNSNPSNFYNSSSLPNYMPLNANSRNLSMTTGLNVIGMSGDNVIQVADIIYFNSSGSKLNYAQAIANGNIISINKTGENNTQEDIIGEATQFDIGNVYWLNIGDESGGQLTIPNAGGNNLTETFSLSDLTFVNNTGVVLNISEAVNSGWVGNGSVDGVVWYYNESAPPLYKWTNLKPQICDYDPDIEEYVCIGGPDKINSWGGYFVYGLKNNITMLRENYGLDYRITTLNEGWNTFALHPIESFDLLPNQFCLSDGTNCQPSGNSSFNQTLTDTKYVPYTGANQNIDLGNNNLKVNGTSLFVNATNGRVGIGTTAPNQKLQVNGSVNATLYYGNGSQLTGILPSWLSLVNYTPTNCSTEGSYSWNVSTPYSPNASIIPNIDGSLVSWWRMDDTNSTGTLVQDYMNRNNGTALGGASQVTNGKFGKSWGFDGVNDYVNASSSSSLNFGENPSFSLTTWIKTSAPGTSAGGGAISKGNALSLSPPAWSLWVPRDTTLIEFSMSNGTTRQIVYFGSYYSLVNDSNWHQVATIVDRNSTTISLYIDGQLKASTALTLTGNIDNTNNLYIGAVPTANNWNGSIDDVMIFNRSLSADEIRSLYNATAYTHAPTTTDGFVYIQNSSAYVNVTTGAGGSTTTCYGGSTLNNTLDFGNTTLLARSFNVHSDFYTGDALSLISGIRKDNSKDTDKDGFTKIDHSTIGGAMEIINGQETQSLDKTLAILLKANQQLIERINNQAQQLIDMTNENQRLKDCARQEDYKLYKECILR